MANEKLVVGKCPNCMTILHIEEGKNISCPCCDQVVTSDEIKNNKVGNLSDGGAQKQGADLTQYALCIENPTSGLAYLENRFETMDWEDFDTNIIFDFEEISAVVEKNKVTNANDPNTWVLEYKSIAEIIKHKLKGLQKLVEEIKEKYNPLDFTNTFETFDKYSRLVNALILRKSNFYKALESDIKFLEKFKATGDTVSEIKSDYASLKAEYDKLHVVESVEEVPGVDKVIEKAQKEIVDRLAKDGIDAEALYQEAISDLDDKANSRFALAKFQQLKGYKDSSKYISKINSLSIFESIIEANGKLFYAKENKSVSTFSVNGNQNANGNEEPTYNGRVISIYEIKDQKRGEKPLVNMISYVLTTYNGKLFFISGDREIKTFDFGSHTVETLDKGKLGCYAKLSATDSSRFIWGADRQSIYIKKRLDTTPVALEKSGCFGKEKGPVEKPKLNNFSLLKIDLVQGKAVTVIPELVDVMDVFGDLIFLTQSRDITTVKEVKKGKTVTQITPKTFFTSYNLRTGEMVDMLDEHAFITGAVDGKVVYSRYSPVTFNMDLFVYDVKSGETLLLEKNIYNVYPEIHNGTVLYTVGSFYKRSMFSIKLDGSDRTEIMLNVETIQWFDENWMYVIKGYSYNKTLIKISYDGKKRVIVATQISRVIEFTAGYIYYVNADGDLCMVRNDGKDFNVITDGCESAKIVIDTDKIFIMRKDWMDSKGKVVDTSLYSMDLQGHNIRKLYYGLTNMEEIDEQRIFFLRKEKKKYKITTPQEKGDPIISYITPMIFTYYSYNKSTHEVSKLLVLGEPKEEKFEFKSGCFGRKIRSANSIIEEVSEKAVFNRKDKMTPGQVAAEDKKKEEMAKNEGTPLASAKSATGLGKNVPTSGGCGCSK